jgi:hypothetical protein
MQTTPRTRQSPRTFIALGIAAAVLNAVFQALSSRSFDIDEAGAFASLSVMVGGFGLLGIGLQVMLVDAAPPPRSRLAGSIACATIGLASVALTPGPGWYRAGVAALLSMCAAFVLLGVPARARLLLDRRWADLGGAYLVGASVRLAALAIGLSLSVQGVLVALAATAAGEAAVTLMARRASRPPQPTTPMLPWARARSALVVIIGLWALTATDSLIARRSLGANDADVYSLASTVARSTFFAALLICQLALPAVMTERRRSLALARVFRRTLLATVAIGALFALSAGAAAPIIVESWPTSTQGGSSVTVLRLLVAAWAVLGVMPIVAFVHLAHRSRLGLAAWVGAAITALAGLVADDDVALAAVMLFAATITVAIALVPALARLRPTTRATPWVGAPPPSEAVGSGPEDSIAIIVPFFDPGGDVLVRTVRALALSLSSASGQYRVIAVSDGSTDGSPGELRRAAIAHVEVFELPTNLGKGAALRAGMARAHEHLVGFIDADGDLPPQQVVEYIAMLRSTNADAVIGSKVHPESALATRAHRNALSWCFRLIVRAAFRLDVGDTQTGLKVFRRSIVSPVLESLREDGFAIDVELLVAARERGDLSVIEARVVIEPRSTSTMSARRALDTMLGLLRVFWRQRVALAYRAADE